MNMLFFIVFITFTNFGAEIRPVLNKVRPDAPKPVAIGVAPYNEAIDFDIQDGWLSVYKVNDIAKGEENTQYTRLSAFNLAHKIDLNSINKEIRKACLFRFITPVEGEKKSRAVQIEVDKCHKKYSPLETFDSIISFCRDIYQIVQKYNKKSFTFDSGKDRKITLMFPCRMKPSKKYLALDNKQIVTLDFQDSYKLAETLSHYYHDVGLIFWIKHYVSVREEDIWQKGATFYLGPDSEIFKSFFAVLEGRLKKIEQNEAFESYLKQNPRLAQQIFQLLELQKIK
ncbi:MAG: hypothetical protein AB7R69_00135 [Candidatus Babeliales bacterium]